ncbi:DNA/RNA non-specific endonuclease [Zhouia sp. PK063]|uniref:DNA/RNA non-specific endonuclease n=1 Tax=Zhouia sp. PK063 TaxID=3373602 RepID=UPI00379DC3F7
MNLKKIYPLLFLFILAACSTNDNPAEENENPTTPTENSVITINETFEEGSKIGYALDNVNLTNGQWVFDNALIGALDSDAKDGNKSVRIKEDGSIYLNFDITGGATTLTLKQAVFGTDDPSQLELLVSTDGGATYNRVGDVVNVTTNTLTETTFNINIKGKVRFKLHKVNNDENRINIDDVVLNSYEAGTDSGSDGGEASTDDNSNLLLGNPSGATSSTSNPNNYLIDETYYTESYSRDRGTPNWVSWYVGTTSLGSTDRQDNFRANTSLPDGWYEVSNTAYSGSGFDRGHNCPSADRTTTTTANSATFLMTNMIPQAPNNNQKTWANLENYIRSEVKGGEEAYVIMGSYGKGGTGSNGTYETLDNGHVTVPSNIYKIVVLIDNGDNDLSRINGTTRVIAVNVPNLNSVNSDWKQYRTSVDEIEKATGYDFLSNVSTNIQAAIEAKVDDQ